MARRKFSAEENIRIELEDLHGEEAIAELCRKESINQKIYCRGSKAFLEAGKKRLAGDAVRDGLKVPTKQSSVGGFG